MSVLISTKGSGPGQLLAVGTVTYMRGEGYGRRAQREESPKSSFPMSFFLFT